MFLAVGIEHPRQQTSNSLSIQSSTRLCNETALDGSPVPHRELITGFDRDGPLTLVGNNSPTLFDPEVVRLASHGTALYHRTPHTVSTSHTLDLGLDLLPSLLPGIIPTPKIGYSFTRTDTGAPRAADAAVRVVGDRVFGPCSAGVRTRANGARWDLVEKGAARSGVPSFLRVGMLLRRRRGHDGQFLGRVRVETEVSGSLFGGGVREAWWRMVGAVPRDEPLVFDPRVAAQKGG
ncbi:hypothetical protein C8A01DRAFT_32461 [Parachaetomium inaequale]|uniref:Uncharacterized protein n=1 Tax=Parachaetomium inaequale TaxID=2588326 RepID=A0AAN6PQC0_9PEZI|nr:hypothetical protein C8A01DRAFT_32461 [Parachaetomium inaequale]